jgi:predicted nucleic acid-binding protein
VQGAAAALGITPQTVFDWLHKGRLAGRQTCKGHPWQISLNDTQIAALKIQMRHTTPSNMEAS